MVHKNIKKPGEDKVAPREGLDKVMHAAKRSAKISMRIGQIATKYTLEISSKLAMNGIDQSVAFARDHWKELLLAAVISSTAYIGTDKALDKYDQWKDMTQRTTSNK